jgi:hypothetical protein
MPFLAAFNPDINWTEGSVKGDIQAFISDKAQWMPEGQYQYINNLN